MNDGRCSRHNNPIVGSAGNCVECLKEPQIFIGGAEDVPEGYYGGGPYTIPDGSGFPTAVSKRIPHKCPVCGGNGLVPAGFYEQVTGEWVSASTEFEQCWTCQRTGIVWEDLNGK